MKNLKHQTKSSIGIKSSHTTLFYVTCGMTGILLLTTIMSSIVLSSSSTHADSTATSNVSVTVDTACTLSASGGGTYSATITPGTTSEITGSTLSTVCNDPNGYSIYAIGYGNDSYDTPTNTQMIGANGIGNIVTGTATSGTTSNWAMKANPTLGSDPTIMNGYNTYQVIPSDYTQIAKYTSSTSSSTATGASIDTKYQVYITSAQIAGTYTGKVKYTMVHPNDAIPQNKYYMQDFTAGMCEVLAHDSPITLYDKRDEQSYTVQKLADGKCWMLDNLRLDLTNSTILNGLTTSNTNVDSTSLTSLKSGNRSAGAQYASLGFVTWAQGDTNNVYNQAKANADYKDTTTTSYGAGSGKIGIYYNYCAASAGSYCYDENAGTGNASYDLCPAGWRMPTGNVAGEYQALYTAYSSDQASFKNALSTPLSGYFNNGSASHQGSFGYFWSSTYGDSNSLYALFVGSSFVFPTGYSHFRIGGIPVRCILGA